MKAPPGAAPSAASFDSHEAPFSDVAQKVLRSTPLLTRPGWS